MTNMHVRLGDLVGWIVSIVATYYFFHYLLKYLGSEGIIWKQSLTLTILILVATFCCPYLNKFICRHKK